MHQLVQGAIGTEYVIKHYSFGPIRTKFPDMTKIIASTRQKKCRNIFKEAVAYAKEVIADPERKKAWQKKLRRRNSVYYAAIREYMLRDKRKKEKDLERANNLLAMALHPRRVPPAEDEQEFKTYDSKLRRIGMADDS